MNSAVALPSIHIFNPETDLALACGLETYTPPARILDLRRRMALLPALWAKPGDIVIIPEGSAAAVAPAKVEAYMSTCLPLFPNEEDLLSAARNAATIKNLRMLGLRDAAQVQGHWEPWGWNSALRHELLRAGVPANAVPSHEAILSLRALAHRRNTIAFHRAWAEIEEPQVALPHEVFDSNALEIAFSELGRACYLKAPWSSSGRGIHFLPDAADADLRCKALEWGRGAIARQGSVMVEHAEPRLFDFASEWEIHEASPLFKGWSFFCANKGGAYGGNLWAPQTIVVQSIKEHLPHIDLAALAQSQRRCLHALPPADYEGPLGIDMLATADGRINPCVEINVRRTMGRAACDWAANTENIN